MKKILLIIIITLLLTGCSPKITEGYVYEKKHHKAWMQIIPIYISTGKGGTMMMIPIFRPEEWYIKISDKRTGEDKETFYITRNQYHTIKIGDYYKSSNDRTEPKKIKCSTKKECKDMVVRSNK